MMLAKTDAAGSQTLLPEVLAFSTSLPLDRQLLLEDVLGSLAHVIMLARTGIIPKASAESIRKGLLDIFARGRSGSLQLPDEEDVHMAVEAELARTVGEASKLLHSARSRNDQVATDLRLHVREQCAVAMGGLADFVLELVARAITERDTLMPAYTHRQRAQPITLAYWLAAYGAMFSRDLGLFAQALAQADVLPLGVGAIAGSSLPIDRSMTKDLLGFAEMSLNGLDTVGDRDFALDYLYAAARFLTHAGRLSTDIIDFTTSEFGFARVSGDIAMGSSMMPQKRNPDVFELVRGKSGRSIGNLTGLFATIKGLPGGYNRDLQEDRASILETGPLANGSLNVLRLALPHVVFDKERCRAAVEEGSTQATDLAEALVTQGVPFREAYKVIGALVAKARELNVSLAKVPPAVALAVDARLGPEVLARLDAAVSVARKKSAGSTGPEAVTAQLDALAHSARGWVQKAGKVPRLDTLYAKLKETTL